MVGALELVLVAVVAPVSVEEWVVAPVSVEEWVVASVGVEVSHPHRLF